MGGRPPAARNRGPRRLRRACGSRAPAPPSPRAVGGSVARGLDLARRAQLRLPAALGPAGRRVWSGDVLRHAFRRAAAEDDRARLRRPRVPPLRRARAGRRAEVEAPRRFRAPVPVSRPVRTRTRRPLSMRGRGSERTTSSRRRASRRFDSPSPQPSPPFGGRGSTGEFPRPSGEGKGVGSPSAPQTLDSRREGLRLLARVGRVGPGEPRGLPGARRLRRAPEGARDRRRGRDPRGARLEAPGSRRRGLSGGPQVGSRREAAGAPALPRLQRGRVRAGHVQGPGPDGGGPVRDRRGDDDRRLRHRLRAGISLRSGRVSARRGAHSPRRRRGPGRGPPRGETSSDGVSSSTSRSGAAPGPTSAARRPPSSTRSRAFAASRETSRPSPSRRDCSASRPSSTTSRRSSTSCRSWPKAARRSRRSARARPPDPSSSVSPATSRGRASTRFRSAPPCARSSRSPAECRTGGRCEPCCSAARPDPSSDPESSTCR